MLRSSNGGNQDQSGKSVQSITGSRLSARSVEKQPLFHSNQVRVGKTTAASAGRRGEADDSRHMPEMR